MPEWIETLFTALGSVLLAVGVPLGIEWLRRPMLRIQVGDPVDDPRWSIVHLRVRNRPLAERGRLARLFGRWLTAFAADGCSVHVRVIGDPESRLLEFDGKWSSRREPLTEHLVATQSDSGVTGRTIQAYDPQKLPGIHHVSLQPGPEGDLVAVAIRPPGGPAYAYWARRSTALRRFPRPPGARFRRGPTASKHRRAPGS